MWLWFTIFSFYRHCVICQPHVSIEYLCRALVFASCMLPAVPIARWVSDSVVGAWRAPSVLYEGPLMGLKPQRPVIEAVIIRWMVCKLTYSHTHICIQCTQVPHTGILKDVQCLMRARDVCCILDRSVRRHNALPVNRQDNKRKCDFISNSGFRPDLLSFQTNSSRVLHYQSEIFLVMSCGNLVKSSSTVIAVH